MTSQYSNPHVVPQIPLSSHILVQESTSCALSVGDLEPADLKSQSKACIDSLIRGNLRLKTKEEELRESRAQTRQSNRDPEAKTKVIDIRSQHVISLHNENQPPKAAASPQSMRTGNPSNSFNYPAYSHGIDPAPEMQGTFMDQHHSKKSSMIVDARKKAYEGKYEAFLQGKTHKKHTKTAAKTVWIEGEWIRWLKEWFQSNANDGTVGKTSIIEWILQDNPAAGVFGLKGSGEDLGKAAESALENIGQGENLTLEEFLGFYQVSKNNKDPNVSVTTWSSDEEETASASNLPQLSSISLYPADIQRLQALYSPADGPLALLSAVELDQALRPLLAVVAREPKGISRYPRETVEEVLRRAGHQDMSMQWDTLLQYFTVRGEPDTGNEVKSDRSRSLSPRHRSSSSEAPLGSRYAITVPSPFHFFRRCKSSIRQTKLQSMLNAKEAEEEAAMKQVFRAQEVPAEVIIPLYDQIRKRQENRREQVRANSVRLTKSREKPFSFYYRDMAKPKPEKIDPEPFVFKANPVPWESTVPLYERMLSEGEESRKDRIESRAKLLLAQAKLPPRMEAKPEASPKRSPPRPQSARPRSKPVPDFSSLQADFQQKLETRKLSAKPTVPQPFQFSESRKTAHYREYMDRPEAERQWQRVKPTNLNKVFQRPSKEPATTEKHKALVELRKREQSAKAQAELGLAQESDDRRSRQARIRPLVHHSEAILDHSRALSARRDEQQAERRRKAVELERNHQVEMAEMMERVYSRPLLVEQVTAQSKRREGEVRDSELFGSMQEVYS